MPAGRPKTPAALKKMRGTYREDTDGGGVAFEPAMPEMPDWVTGYGEELWHRLGPMLFRKSLLCLEYGESFAALCNSWHEYRRAVDLVRENGEIAINGSGAPMQHPAVLIRNAAWKQFGEICRQFGLTPASASSVTTLIEAAELEDVESLLN